MQLEKINQVNDIKQLNKKELQELAEEIRRNAQQAREYFQEKAEYQ